MKKPKSFEEGSAALQQVLDQLSDPATPLDKAIKLYSDAASLHIAMKLWSMPDWKWSGSTCLFRFHPMPNLPERRISLHDDL